MARFDGVTRRTLWLKEVRPRPVWVPPPRCLFFASASIALARTRGRCPTMHRKPLGTQNTPWKTVSLNILIRGRPLKSLKRKHSLECTAGALAIPPAAFRYNAVVLLLVLALRAAPEAAAKKDAVVWR